MARRKVKKVKLTKGKVILLLLVAIVAAVVLYLSGVLIPDKAPKEVSGELQVHFLDVGQGDCILVMSEGEYMLVDTGDRDDTYNQKIVNYLKEYRITTIDYLVLTHPDSDHIGGAPDVINEFDVGKCIMPDFEKSTKIFEQTLDALEDRQVEVIEAIPGDEFSVGEVDCKILAPLYRYSDSNDASVVIHMTFGANSVLLTGDAEAESEADIVNRYSAADLKADVLKSGHHGSSTSSTPELLDMVDPGYVIISCGAGNDYGHPHKQTLDKYQSRDIEVYRTDISGTIIMKSDGENIMFYKEK